MTEGQDLCAQDKFADGIKMLREAYELDENNSLTRAVFANALVEQARIVAESSWQEAEQLAQQALELNPGHPLAKTIRTLISDQRREQIVGECLSQARKLQAGGDLAGALARIEEGLAAYPREPRLIQIQETVQRELQSQRRQMRRRDLEELRRMEREAETITDAKVKQVFGERVQALARKHVDDEEVLPVANALLERLNIAPVRAGDPSQIVGEERLRKEPVPGSGAVGSAEGSGATQSVYSPATMDVPASLAERPPASPPSPDVTGALAASTGSQAKSPASRAKPSARSFGAGLSLPNLPSLKAFAQTSRGRVIVASAAGAALLLAFTLLLVRPGHRHGATPPVAKFTVRVHTTPPGATVRINNEVRGLSDLQVELPEGNYQVEAQLDGYAPKTSSLEAKAGSPNSLQLIFEPALPVLKLSSDTGTGKVQFDDQPAVELGGAQWALDKIALGEHKLKFDGPQGDASFTFSADPAALPVINGRIVAKGVLAVIVGNLGSHLHVYCSEPGARISLDGQTPADVSQDGLELPPVSPGAHELALTHGNDQYKLDVDVGPVPTLATFLESGQNIGTLVVATGEDKVRVFLNGQLQKDITQGGQLRIPNLEPKDYVVKVAKSGFQELPEQRVRIRKGEQSRLTFNLQPIPHLATLSIQGGPAGAQVLMDQSALGTVQPDGSFSVATVSPGDHIVELRKEHFKPKRLQKHFVAGVNVALTAADAALEAATGEVRITFTPADAVVNVTKAGEAPIKVASGSTLSLPPGSYILTAKTAENLTRTTTVEVVAGQSKSLDFPLAPSGMSKWDDPAGWKPDRSSFVHKGGDYVLYSASPSSGTFTFSAMLLKGHRLQWVLNYLDANNYVLFQMDENNFYRTVVHNGQKGDEFKVAHKTDKKSFRTMQIHVTPSEIVHQTRAGDAWVVLDKWSVAGTNLSSGKFGFYIPGNDQVALSNFSHYADLSTQH